MEYLIGIGVIVSGILLVVWWWVSRVEKAPVSKPGQRRIACVGDSITYGFLVMQRHINCYPAQLKTMLSDNAVVANFGVNGRTVSSRHPDAYIKHRHYQISLNYQPEVVFLMLGTNDTKADNLKNYSDFAHDYRLLVESYLNLASKPHVVLMTPCQLFKVWNQPEVMFTMDEERLAQIVQIIKTIGIEYNLALVDINALSKGHPEWFGIDGVHPNHEGALMIAQMVAQDIKKLPLGV